MEGKLIENTSEFEKVEICRRLFNRCSLIELLTVEQMQRTGELRKKTAENQLNTQSNNNINKIHYGQN
ncbi:MAG: hypothetical protein Q8N05_05435 [Bacteroidota bacterium]|nr:hypothetical protein [Bacteroidota bacterium]